MRETSVLNAKRRAWAALSKYVRLRDKHCVTCGRETTEAGHYKHNTDKVNQQLGGNELWYDDKNVNGQCGYCNRWKSGNLSEYGLYLESTHGFGILQDLQKKYMTRKMWTVPELLAVAKKYETLCRAF